PHRSPESDDRVRVLVVPEASGVSSTAARAGQRDWMAADAAAFDHETGAWSDADRYRRWLERESSRAAGSAGGDGG
ncbi:MAG: hypothetical protein ACRDZQ_07635, partial [Acidimicrobiales bacterium]